MKTWVMTCMLIPRLSARRVKFDAYSVAKTRRASNMSCFVLRYSISRLFVVLIALCCVHPNITFAGQSRRVIDSRLRNRERSPVTVPQEYRTTQRSLDAVGWIRFQLQRMNSSYYEIVMEQSGKERRHPLHDVMVDNAYKIHSVLSLQLTNDGWAHLGPEHRLELLKSLVDYGYSFGSEMKRLGSTMSHDHIADMSTILADASSISRTLFAADMLPDQKVPHDTLNRIAARLLVPRNPHAKDDMLDIAIPEDNYFKTTRTPPPQKYTRVQGDRYWLKDNNFGPRMAGALVRYFGGFSLRDIAILVRNTEVFENDVLDVEKSKEKFLEACCNELSISTSGIGPEAYQDLRTGLIHLGISPDNIRDL